MITPVTVEKDDMNIFPRMYTKVTIPVQMLFFVFFHWNIMDLSFIKWYTHLKDTLIRRMVL